MKKFVCTLVAFSFLLGACLTVTAGDKAKDENKAKEQVKKADGEKAKADKPKTEKAKKTPQDRFNALDTDGNKKVSKEEFIGKREGEKKDKAEQVFGKLDKDSSGDLSLEELTPAKKPAKEKKPQEKKADKPAKEKKPAE